MTGEFEFLVAEMYFFSKGAGEYCWDDLRQLERVGIKNPLPEGYKTQITKQGPGKFF
jgi:hypothetical protein